MKWFSCFLLCWTQALFATPFTSHCTSAELTVTQTVKLSLPESVRDPIFSSQTPTARMLIGRTDALAIMAQRVSKQGQRNASAILLEGRLAAAPEGKVLTHADLERDFREFQEPQRNIELLLGNEIRVLVMTALQQGSASVALASGPATTLLREAYEGWDPMGKVFGVRFSQGEATIFDYCLVDPAQPRVAE